jgi:uncharacterized protein (DUF1800 family)
VFRRLPDLRELKDAPIEEKMAVRRELLREGVELQGWWMREILATPAPLTERMTLFWHNHFTSSLQKVKAPQLLYRQNLLLRTQALGNFRSLLHGIARDPAMIVYLDGFANRQAHPNENFARELLELFTLGEGHYGEQDVKEAARAFTGWSIERDSGAFRQRWPWHDRGQKTFLGQRGDFDGDDVLDIILEQPQTAQFIVEKLWREFVSPTPDAAQVQRIAARFRRDWQIAPVLEALLTSPQFRDPANGGSLIKSPVDLVAGTLRTLQVPVDDGRFPALVCAQLGQALFNPPNVKGWPGGDAWINSATLVAREQFLDSLSRGFNDGTPMEVGMAGGKNGLLRAALAQRLRTSAQGLDVERYLADFTQRHPPAETQALLLATAPVLPADRAAAPAERLRALLLDPAYQLK